MRANRHGWRWLTAILQIAAFVLFVLPAPGQAAAHRHAGFHAAPAQAAVGHHHAAVAADPADVSPETAGGHDTCWLGCCSCHAVVETAPAAPERAAWSARRLPVPSPDAARPDAAPEALPEPPRTHA